MITTNPLSIETTTGAVTATHAALAVVNDIVRVSLSFTADDGSQVNDVTGTVFATSAIHVTLGLGAYGGPQLAQACAASLVAGKVELCLALNSEMQDRIARSADGAAWLEIGVAHDTGPVNLYSLETTISLEPLVERFALIEADVELVLSDAGKLQVHPASAADPHTVTIPANAAVPFPVGTEIPLVNQAGAGDLTLAITTDTLRLAGASGTTSRTLAANGVARLLKIAATEWIVSGTGLT